MKSLLATCQQLLREGKKEKLKRKLLAHNILAIPCDALTESQILYMLREVRTNNKATRWLGKKCAPNTRGSAVNYLILHPDYGYLHGKCAYDNIEKRVGCKIAPLIWREYLGVYFSVMQN